jgi:glycosyltransferase involved in cell wall biosynthesis
MRILFISARGDAFGGAALHVRDMAARLVEEGHKVRILVGGTRELEVPRRFEQAGLDFVCIESMGRVINPWKDFRTLITLRREIRSFSPDLVSCHASKGGALGRIAGLGCGVPIIYTPHCWSFVDGFPHAWLYRMVERGLAPFATRIVAVCEDEYRFGLSQKVGREEQTLFIHNGVVDAVDRIDRQPRAADEAARILMVGRFEQQKDHGLLLSALAKLKDLNWTLTLVGDGPSKAACIDQAARLGLSERITFAGYSDQVEDFLSGCDLFALVSRWEGFPRSILEAMCESLPVLTSDVGGSKEAVIDGETGRVVKPGDLNELIAALRELVTAPDLCRRMGERGRQVYLERFSFDLMYQKYLRLYRSLLRK